jgi:signal transduction histidine kinase
VLGDASLLDLALRNVIENAIHHNVDAGTIQVTLRREGTDAILEIANSGTVLDGDIDRLREPFYRHAATRLGATDRAPGFGLGLSLVDRVVTLHRGELVLEARAEGGLLVTVRLPLASDGRPCSQEPVPSGRRDGPMPLA